MHHPFPTFFILINLILSSTTISFSQDKESVRKAHYNLEKGLALEGYDPVSYFESSKPKKGSKGITYQYNGVTYRFSTEENKKLFEADPKKYEPEYGGWCAYAMGLNGEKVGIDPETYKIKEGKLYLFYNAFFTNTLPKWNEDEKNLKPKADEYWQKVIE